jgi:4-hydroxyphenylpyruvate dioxygenase
MPTQKNDIALDGIEFIEFASDKPEQLERLFLNFGFSKLKKHATKDVTYFCQNDIHFMLNNETGTAADKFRKLHGPSICSMGWRVADAKKAMELTVQRGATACTNPDYRYANGEAVPAIYGIGNSIIYFIENYQNPKRYENLQFKDLEKPTLIPQKGFTLIDHLTNNVEKGTMQKWSNFYKDIFGFVEVRYFDIKGAKTGLTSFALRSPCGKFCIPINEGTEDKSQINEYLREYKGPGVQHLAFLTDDILSSLRDLEGSRIETLDIDDQYYGEVFDRVPNVREDHKEIRKYNVLVDGDAEGYLLQIFTKNLVGPIFIEIIQRRNHYSFGEGNFGALFRSIERDQEKRGVL